MIDATKSPMPLWRRYASIALLIVIVAAVGWFVWTKEIHKSTASSAPPVPAAAQTAKAPTTTVPPTTVPGGLAISNRNPFGNG